MLRKSLHEGIRPILLNHLKFRLNLQKVLRFSHKIYTCCKIPRVSSLYIATALIWLIFVVETQYVLCEVGNKLLNKITLIFVLKSFKSMYLYTYYIFLYKFLCCFQTFCVVLYIVCFVSFCVLFVCKCALYYCHRVATQLQLNIYHIISYHIAYIMSYHIIYITSYHILYHIYHITSYILYHIIYHITSYII